MISGENQRASQRLKVKKVKNQANSDRALENRKLVAVNEIQRNDLVDERDVKSQQPLDCLSIALFRP